VPPALFPETNPIIEELTALGIHNLTPIEALNRLYEWKKVGRGWSELPQARLSALKRCYHNRYFRASITASTARGAYMWG